MVIEISVLEAKIKKRRDIVDDRRTQNDWIHVERTLGAATSGGRGRGMLGGGAGGGMCDGIVGKILEGMEGRGIFGGGAGGGRPIADMLCRETIPLCVNCGWLFCFSISVFGATCNWRGADVGAFELLRPGTNDGIEDIARTRRGARTETGSERVWTAIG